MNMLLIYAHPNHKSLSYSFMQQVLRGADENAQVNETRVLDLYEEGFDPVLMFKIMVVQALFPAGDEATEFQIKDRLSF